MDSSDIVQQKMTQAAAVLIAILVFLIVLVALYVETGRPYANARQLYSDCAESNRSEPVEKERRMLCARYLNHMLDNWYLSQDSAICARHAGDELPDADVAYWQRRGMSVLSGVFRSAEKSADEVFDGDAETCEVPNPRLHPP